MSNHPRRFFAWLLALTLLVPLLAACGGAGEPAAPAATTEAPAAEATEAPAAEATEEPAAEATEATEEPAAEATEPAAEEPAAGDKTIILGYNQFPDTLFTLASQSSMTSQVVQFFQPGCVTLLDYEFQPVCFDELPSLDNGGLVSETVTINPADISDENPVLINGEVITSGAELGTEPLELPQLTARWTLKDGIAWQDGTPMTAEDFAFTYQLQTSPDVPVATTFTADRTVAIEAVDEKTIQWQGIPGFVDPTYVTNFVIDNSSYNVLPKHVFESVAPGDMVNQDFATLPVAYGPFQIAEYLPQESITFERNPEYWRASEGLPKVDSVIIKFLSDEDQVLAQLESGDIDIGGTIGLTLNSADTLDEWQEAGTHDVQYVPATVWEHIDMAIERGDGQPSFFDDVRVRQAMAYGINRQQIVDEVLGGRTVVMNAFQPEDYWAFPADGELNEYAYDPEQATALLAEAGWTPGADGILEKEGRRFSIQFFTTEGNRTREQVAQIIQAQLQEIGIEMELNFVPATEVLFKNGEDGILQGRRYDMAMYAWIAGVEPSANLYLCSQVPTAENNWAGQNPPAYCNEEYDAVTNQVYNLLEREDRTPLLIESMKIFNRDIPTLPLYQRVQIAAFRTGVTGVEINPSTYVDFSFPEELDITLE
jgi:peptide/nickel transport system substrate-binding protein